MHEALKAVLDDVQHGRMSAEEAIDAADKVSPALAKSLRAFRGAFGVITFALAVIGTYYGFAGYQLSKEQTAIAREALALQKAAEKVSFEDKVREANVLRTLLANQAALADQTRRIEAGLADAPKQQTGPKAEE